MFEGYNKVQQAVLETTLGILIEKDLQATSMALIAKQSGVSTGNIYHYFGSKEAIINELYKAIVRFNGEFVLKGFYDTNDFRQRFERVWDNYVRLSLEYSQGFRFLEQYSFSPYIYPESKEEAYAGGWCGPMNKLYAEAIDRGLFVKENPAALVQMHTGSFVYLIKGHLQGRFQLTEEMAWTAIRACWNSICSEKTATPDPS
ncbi:TetR/AcrR family transcriptional regulator [Paenibacillus farraposensis]|uniref:TetR/AcrR family transcriptional regulator n=1 Tax=Paenibacillus farraposensis TaxID=2807095 RepID=A0ABW4DA56_9BACL|nr:TetR/AcrR family transcriptional regulator [Paenibacillus farraposensis]MCC3381656.1 TetR/AcrR family transcriptional regulator [Paenibacillus farraposensis]